VNWPETTGIMVLRQTVFFPNTLMPLRIFEPRYREMLARALQGERMFAIALESDRADDSPKEIGTLGLVRACVENEDGTSNLILQGVRRIRFRFPIRHEPYPCAPFDIIDDNIENLKFPELSARIRAYVQTALSRRSDCIPDTVEFLQNIGDDSILCDVVAGNLLENITDKQHILETISLEKRLSLLFKALKKQLG
jgi:Lon protease-like protein